MRFESRPQAYLHCLSALQSIYDHQCDVAIKSKLKLAIDQIRVFTENHEQDHSKVVAVINSLKDFTHGKEGGQFITCLFDEMLKALRHSDYEQTPKQKWENPYGRRFESQIQTELLFNPTDKMMQAVGGVSEKIINYLYNYDLTNDFIDYLTKDSSEIAFGCFDHYPNPGELVNVLLKNNKGNLDQIMFIHFKFAQNFARNAQNYFNAEDKVNGVKVYAMDEEINTNINRVYEDDYYDERGRGGDDEYISTNILGIGTNSSSYDKFNKGYLGGNKFRREVKSDELELWSESESMSESESKTSWVADSKVQRPEFSSPYVQSLIDNDTPYVAGPSGMTACFIGQMLALTSNDKSYNLTNRREYLAAVTAYMVSGGFHSLHEVLGPIRHCLKNERLMPEKYVSTIPSAGDLGKPPNYNEFYQMMMAIDPEFAARRDDAYNELNIFIAKHCAENDSNIEDDSWLYYEKIIILVNELLSGINNYIDHKKPSNVMFRLMPSVSKGIKRAENYKYMLLNAASGLQQLIIMYALLKSDSGTNLKQSVLQGLNQVAVKQHLVYFIKGICGDKLMQEIETVLDKDFLPIINKSLPKADCCNLKKGVGVFADALDKLKEIEQQIDDRVESVPGLNNNKR